MQFKERNDILILDSGETGMNLVYLAVKSNIKSITLSHRYRFYYYLTNITLY